MRVPTILAIALCLGACAARPAEVRVAFDRVGDTAVVARGIADRGTGRRADGDTLFRVASVSKLVVALGVMRLVEAGTLDLDADVSDALGWRLRHPAHPDRPVTLRLLLSHRSGLVDGADYIVPLGTTMRAALADPRFWNAGAAPGVRFAYANIGYGVVGTVVEAATRERFDRVMARTVLAPLGLDACFNWGAGCSDAAVARAGVLYRADGRVARDDLRGRRPDCAVVADGACDLAAYRPGDNGALFSPQGGLRVPARDLARIGRMLLAGGGGFLRRESLAAMTAPAWTYDGTNGDTSGGVYCAYGLGMQLLPNAAAGCADRLFADDRPRVGHSGEAYGLRSGLWVDAAAGRGVAYVTTAVPDGARGRRSGYAAAGERLAGDGR